MHFSCKSYQLVWLTLSYILLNVINQRIYIVSGLPFCEISDALLQVKLNIN